LLKFKYENFKKILAPSDGERLGEEASRWSKIFIKIYMKKGKLQIIKIISPLSFVVNKRTENCEDFVYEIVQLSAQLSASLCTILYLSLAHSRTARWHGEVGCANVHLTY
jgi:hypothetical protein